MRIPILDLKAQLAAFKPEVMAAIERVVDSQALVLGAEVEAFERAIAEYMGLEAAIGVSSGTDASNCGSASAARRLPLAAAM